VISAWMLRWLPTALLGVLLTAGVVFGVHYLKEQGRDEIRPQVKELQEQLAAETSNRQRSETAANAYLAELEYLRRRPVPAGPVRLCRNPVPRPGNPAPVPDGPAAAAGGDVGPAGGDLEAGPDIGPDLRGLARDCDAEIAKLRALQGWINDVR
jgi:hypothetical protein